MKGDDTMVTKMLLTCAEAGKCSLYFPSWRAILPSRPELVPGTKKKVMTGEAHAAIAAGENDGPTISPIVNPGSLAESPVLNSGSTSSSSSRFPLSSAS